VPDDRGFLSRSQDRLVDRIRDPKRLGDASRPGAASDFAGLQDAEYAVVVTFRRTGEPVITPMYFGLHEGRAYVRSLRKAGKVKRLRNDTHVRVAPAGIRGVPKGGYAEGTARLLPEGQESDFAEQVIAANYGLRRRLFEGLGKRFGGAVVYIELTPAGEAG
jgi:uncharacterized protein